MVKGVITAPLRHFSPPRHGWDSRRAVHAHGADAALLRNIGRAVNWTLPVDNVAIDSGSLFDGDARRRRRRDRAASPALTLL